MLRHSVLLVLVCASLVCIDVRADLVGFNNRSSWSAIAGDVQTVSLDDVTSDHNIGLSGIFDAGPFTISASGSFATSNGVEAYDPNPTDIQDRDRNINGTSYYSGDIQSGTTVTITFDDPVSAFGFDFTNINFGIFNDHLLIAGEEFYFGAFPDGFIGVAADASETFGSVTVVGADGAWGADDFSFVLASSGQSIPEAGGETLLLMVAVSAIMRRRK